MSGGKVTVGGTNYKVVGGMTYVGGVRYGIGRGKTTIGGTAYNIQLKPLTLRGLLKNAWLLDIAGNDTSSGSTVSTSWGYNGTAYVFSAYAGYLGVHKIVGTTSSITSVTKLLAGSGQGNIYVNGKNIYCAGSAGTSARTARGQSLVICSFPGYSVSQIDSLLSAMNIQRWSSRNGSSQNTVTANTSLFTNSIVLSHSGENMAFTYVTAYNNYEVLLSATLESNESLLYMTSSTTGYSTTGTSNTSVYGGGLAAIT